MSKKSMYEIIEDLESVQSQLKELGISPEMADKLQNAMDSYISVKEEIIKNRGNQFSEDAYRLLSEIKSFSNKNQDSVSIFLRRFAVHIAKNTMSLEKTISSPEDIVDRIPSLFTDEDEYKEA